MFVKDLVAELQKFPALSTVFLFDEEGQIQRIGDTAEIWARSAGEFGSTRGPYTEVELDADEYGVLLV